MDESWMDELRELDGVLRPTAEALPSVQEQVRRRRRLRAFGGALGAAGLVGAVTVGAVLISSGDDRPGSAGPIAGTPTPTPSAPSETESPVFDCGHVAGRINVFTALAPPIPERSLAEQRTVIDQVQSREWTGFRIVGAEPTHLGVVVLVTGDWEAANHALLPEGVRQVALQATELGTAHDQVMNFVQELLDPAINDFNRSRRGIPGYLQVAVWQEAGAIVVDWKAPIPDAIEALAGTRSDGVRVIVQAVRYSAGDMMAAGNKVAAAMRSHEVDAQFSTASGCNDGSGLVVGIEPDSLGSRKAELEEQLSEIAGMPVHVIAEAAPVPL